MEERRACPDRRVAQVDVVGDRRTSPRRGRPSVCEGETTRLCLVLSSETYDRVYDAARVSRVSVPEVIRRILTREFRNIKSENVTT
jgi:hypothetical protein